MKKKILTVFALLLLLLCACAQTKKELTFEEKMKLPGGTSDTEYVISDPSIKTFADYEQKYLIEPDVDYAVALVPVSYTHLDVYKRQVRYGFFCDFHSGGKNE